MLDLGLLVFGRFTGQPGVKFDLGIGVNMPVPGAATVSLGQLGGCLEFGRGSMQFAALHAQDIAGVRKGGQA